MTISIILQGCGHKPAKLESDPVDVVAAATAAAEKAVSDVRRDGPPLPGDCYVDTPHAPLVEGEELSVTLDRERKQLDAANDKRYRCAKFSNTIGEVGRQVEPFGGVDGT